MTQSFSSRQLIWPVVTVLFILGLFLAYKFLGDAGVDGPDPVDEIAVQRPESEQSIASDQIMEPVMPGFDIVRLSPSGTGVIAGRAAPHREVILFADGKEVARTRADARGEWVIILDTALPAGPTEFSLEVLLEDGSSLASSDIVVVAVPEMDDAAAGEGILAVLTPRNGQGPSRALQVPTNGLAQDLASLVRLETIDLNADGQTSFSGRGEAGVELRLYVDNAFQGQVIPDEQGFWNLTIETPMPASDETRQLRIDQVVRNGQVTLRVEQAYDPLTGMSLGKAERAVEVQSGNNLWAIARNLYGSGWRYVYIFQANAVQIRDPDLIYPGQLFALPDQEDSNSEDVNPE